MPSSIRCVSWESGCFEFQSHYVGRSWQIGRQQTMPLTAGPRGKVVFRHRCLRGMFQETKMTYLKILIVIVVGLVVMLVLAGQLGLLRGSAPANIGVREGRLLPPSTTPNSVSSQASLYPDHPQLPYAKIEPFRYSGDGKAAMVKIAGIVRGMERTEIIKDGPGYLYAQCTTKLLHFTDDLEFYLDEPAGVIQVRSASRIGHGDRGVNRARVEAIRAKFNAA
jgi:uncharacterized protein (DUF1499 family)